MLKSFLRHCVSLWFKTMWRLFPNLCRVSCLRILRALQWFAQRDRDLYTKICSYVVDTMVARVEVWLQNGIDMATFIAFIPSKNPFYRFEKIIRCLPVPGSPIRSV